LIFLVKLLTIKAVAKSVFCILNELKDLMGKAGCHYDLEALLGQTLNQLPHHYRSGMDLRWKDLGGAPSPLPLEIRLLKAN
jgi:hypothetical protein